METLQNGITLETGNCFPLSTDSMLLAHFAKLPRNATVLDFGSGAGTLGLLLCAKDGLCTVTGIEISPEAHALAAENILRNHLENRFTNICGDFRSIPLPKGSYHVCLSNPPYFSGGPASQENPLARREDCCSPEELFAAASGALRYGGDFYLVHRPERLAQLCACAVTSGLEPKRLQLVRHRDGDAISLILLQCRKGGKPGLAIEEIHLFEKDGSPSKVYRDIYHI